MCTSSPPHRTPGDAVPAGTRGKLLGFCKDIAKLSGIYVEYLERKMFVHRDLATRNILVADETMIDNARYVHTLLVSLCVFTTPDW